MDGYGNDFFSKKCASFKVIQDFGTNRKCESDFQLVRHSNLGPVLHRFRDIAGFCAMTHAYSTLILVIQSSAFQ